MPVYHIVLFKLKPGVTASQLTEWKDEAKALIGQIPGLVAMEVGQPLAITAQRAQGFDMGLVSTLEGASYLKGYAEHPAHLKIARFRTELCTDSLTYDLEFFA
ncbi:hypothetical protein PV10_08414 [Exophiala mesophila]|uniref:Stress-response A/B barrel domain-containing protein n=1 Tax=Exophiala mesophila TaxID=212818 RepID=A0A0D1Z4B8_EXOME|nr:uncharacterized protein PV10_08414 [Exophiala mesophila]KIV88769.1 hypothetical protein PV10_08414 [Exophiala mesophila]